MKNQLQKEEREIMGEVEGYSTNITPFPGNRGSRGLKLENEWHNVIGNRDFLELLIKTFAPGKYVQFREAKNKKGFWDVVEGSLKLISRDEAYGQKTIEENPQEPVSVEEIEEKQGNDFIEVPREDILGWYKTLINNPRIPSLNLPITKKPSYKITANLMIAISEKGPKIITQILDGDPQTALLLLLAETEMAKQMLIEKLLKLKNNIVISANDTPTGINLSSGKA